MTIKYDFIHQLPVDNSTPTKLELDILNTISTQHQHTNSYSYSYDSILVFFLFFLYSTKYSDNLVSSLFPCFKDSYIITFVKIILFSFIFFIISNFYHNTLNI